MAGPTITETAVVSGGRNALGQPTPSQQLTLTADPRKEYAAGQPRWVSSQPQALAWSIDDITDAYDDSVYERMLFDAMVSACFTILKTAILDEGLRLIPAVDDKDDPDYAKSAEILAFCERVLANLETPLFGVLYNMADALALGNKVAEQVYAYDTTYTGKTRLILRALKVKPRHSTVFVVDAYRNVVGLMALQVGQAAPLAGWGGLLITEENKADILPRSKFAVLSWQTQDEDPRGTSVLRPAYTAWAKKIGLWDDHDRFLMQFASPVPIGIAGEHALPYIDSETGVSITPQQAILNALANWGNGAPLAFGPGADIKTLFASSDGAAFMNAFDHRDSQIAIAILGQTLAQGAGQNAHSRAGAQVHERVTDTIVRNSKPWIEEMVRRDVLVPLVVYNYGAAARRLVPRASLGTAEPQTFADDMTALGHVGYTVDPSQFPGIDAKYNLPLRETDIPDDPAADDSTDPSTPPPPPPPTQSDDAQQRDGDNTEGQGA